MTVETETPVDNRLQMPTPPHDTAATLAAVGHHEVTSDQGATMTPTRKDGIPTHEILVVTTTTLTDLNQEARFTNTRTESAIVAITKIARWKGTVGMKTETGTLTSGSVIAALLPIDPSILINHEPLSLCVKDAPAEILLHQV